MSWRKEAVFRIAPEQKDYFERNDLFGPEVAAAFPSCERDVRNAGSCYALRQEDACVPHLMLVLERGLYALAAKVKSVLYQQPCYCQCDKEMGHTSLLSCYTDRHASVCALCQKEAVLAYTETKKGKTPAQIRKEIIDGKWKDVDLSEYETSAASN